ncbi:Chaperone of endosialidase [Bradyrhizobium lablabi]|uniref:Chaperone of endosialidase n=1 Tax=Bradyrhizobium lablabi TaxID=722472 RepID=A0A1M6XRD6_9BRAD|nr:tail fiber domain-containing protein [Bradyrhizobium lablabi]SHL08531.1 Chaperone of endosialidase [Bradyrhizobium lablabi]
MNAAIRGTIVVISLTSLGLLPANLFWTNAFAAPALSWSPSDYGAESAGSADKSTQLALDPALQPIEGAMDTYYGVKGLGKAAVNILSGDLDKAAEGVGKDVALGYLKGKAQPAAEQGYAWLVRNLLAGAFPNLTQQQRSLLLRDIAQNSGRLFGAVSKVTNIANKAAFAFKPNTIASARLEEMQIEEYYSSHWRQYLKPHVSSLGPAPAPAQICIGTCPGGGSSPDNSTITGGSKDTASGLSGTPETQKISRPNFMGGASSLPPNMTGASSPPPGKGPGSNSGPTTAHVSLPGGYFGKATANADRTVTVFNNFGSVTLTQDQFKQVAAGNLAPVAALMGGSGGNGGKLTGQTAYSAPRNSGSSDVSGLGPSSGKLASASGGTNIKIDPALLRTKSQAPVGPAVVSLGAPARGSTYKIDIGSVSTEKAATPKQSTISGTSASQMPPMSSSSLRATPTVQTPTSRSPPIASTVSSTVQTSGASTSQSPTITVHTPSLVGGAVSNAASSAAGRAAAGAASRTASTAASGAASNAASGAAGRAASSAASGAAGRAASSAASGAASRAASSAASGAAGRAASSAASSAASRVASTAAAGAASRAASNAAGRAAANAASNAASRVKIPSDVRLKRDIVALGRIREGLQLYRYRYRGSGTLYVGVMAQEVALVDPDAVTRDADGYLRVDYGRLGLQFMTWEQWTRQSSQQAEQRFVVQ